MHYVCIENNKIVSVLNYEPNVPDTVHVVPISNTEAQLIQQRTHYFDVSTCTVLPRSQTTMQAQEQLTQNSQAKAYLQNTDWQVLRHIRQLHLGEPTSLTAEEYTQLERERARRAAQIKS